MGDEVQRSLELLDRVLSEFDDPETGNGGDGDGARSRGAEAPGHVSSTPEDESPSLGGHQSEDDGYMSMNGRRAKFALSFRPVPDEGPALELPPAPDPPQDPPPTEMADFPPPPEEAERIISTLLPRVSPGNSAERSTTQRDRAFLNAMTLLDQRFEGSMATTATQTTLPKTRHLRPYGWETGTNVPSCSLQEPPNPQLRFGSLPYDGALQYGPFPPPWLQRPGPLPPRTLPGAIERHREVRRRGSEDDGDGSGCGGEEPCPPMRMLNKLTDDDHANFSDDSLEELLPPPLTSKRSSVAWEVPLGADDTDPLLTPGSTKVVGRRKRRSGEQSSTGSIHRLRDHEEWPDPPVNTENEAMSPFSDSYYDSSITNDNEELGHSHPGISGKNMTPIGTYIIRKGRKKERKVLECVVQPPEIIKYDQQLRLGDLKRCSSTFDNIKSLLKEGLLEGLDEPPPDFSPPTPPALVRVVSLPSLAGEDSYYHEFFNGLRHHGKEDDADHSKTDVFHLSRPHELAVTMEEEEDTPYCFSLDDKDLTESDVNEEERRLIEQLEKQQLSTSSESLPMTDRLLSQEYLLKELITDGKSMSHLKDTSNYCRESGNDDHPRNRYCNISYVDEPEKIATRNSQGIKISQGRQKKKKATTQELDAQWSTTLEINADVHTVPVVLMDELTRASSADSGSVAVGMLHHKFPPLPPSPVEEDDNEYSEILKSSPARTPDEQTDTLPEPFYRSLEPPGSDPCGVRFLNQPRPSEPPPHLETISSIRTLSMDTGFKRGSHNHNGSSKREVPSERRTLPSELPGPLRRQTLQKRSLHSPREETLQTSCSLPETPIFARGCDIPRTPHRRAPDIPGMARTAPRPGGLATSGYRRVGTGPPQVHCTGVALGSGGLGQAIASAELLRLAGGPGRGWYPRHRQHRPASIEHLDRLGPGQSPGHNTPSPWDSRDSRKPLTLPPNLSPKFFHRSPREALRRVTSLLIRKGNGAKETKKDAMSPTRGGCGEPSAEGSRQKRGFFKNFWKKSRHYSLEHQQ